MEFIIRGNSKEVKPVMEEFVKLCNEEAKKSRTFKIYKRLSGKLKLPHSLFSLVLKYNYKEDYVILEVISIAPLKIGKRKMLKNLKGYLKAKNVMYDRIDVR
ncbi:MAG: hypothetical protein ACE5KE_00195 [Methanosarcinales archaeon]